MTEQGPAEAWFGAVVFDCQDPSHLAEFWAAVTGYELRSSGERWASVADPARRGPELGFQKVPESKTGKNRVHLDLYSWDEARAAKRVKSLGATRLWVSDDPEDVFIVFADPEGNEFLRGAGARGRAVRPGAAPSPLASLWNWPTPPAPPARAPRN